MLWWSVVPSSFLASGISLLSQTLNDIDTDTAPKPKVHKSPIPLTGPIFHGQDSDIHTDGIVNAIAGSRCQDLRGQIQCPNQANFGSKFNGHI